jgi:hypothetical protein
MKTTLDLDDELLVRAKALAAREGRSLRRSSKTDCACG